MARAESPYRKLVVVETYETGRFFGREVQEARNDAYDNGVLEDDFDKWEAEFNSICAAEWEKLDQFLEMSSILIPQSFGVYQESDGKFRRISAILTGNVILYSFLYVKSLSYTIKNKS